MLTRWNGNSTGWPLSRWSDFGPGDFSGAFASLERMRQEMDQLFSQFDTTFQLAELGMGAGWPRMTLVDQGDKYLLRVELPGVRPDDLELTVEANRITIRGERKDDAPDGYSVHQKERGAMRFAKSFALPGAIDADAAVASLANGVLALELPKCAQARPRQIPVKV